MNPTIMIPSSDPRKRKTGPANQSPDSEYSTTQGSSKRPRLYSFPTNTLPDTMPRSYPSTDHPRFPQLTIPHPSANCTKNQTMSLKLEIPEHVPSDKEKRQLAVRKAAAKRWEESGKLQRPEPKQKEIKAAYNLKLLRHYPDPARGTDASVPTPKSSATQDNIIKPAIKKSERVTNLLKAFPTLDTSGRRPGASYYNSQADLDDQKLHLNKKITSSTQAKQLAWQSFAKPERPQRDVMVESALATDDFSKEHRGVPNRLPEWKKFQTSEYVVDREEKLCGGSKRDY